MSAFELARAAGGLALAGIYATGSTDGTNAQARLPSV